MTSFEKIAAAMLAQKKNAAGHALECLFCTGPLPKGRPGRPPIVCMDAQCRAAMKNLTAARKKGLL